jgi:hypothetical protein
VSNQTLLIIKDPEHLKEKTKEQLKPLHVAHGTIEIE